MQNFWYKCWQTDRRTKFNEQTDKMTKTCISLEILHMPGYTYKERAVMTKECYASKAAWRSNMDKLLSKTHFSATESNVVLKVIICRNNEQ